MDDYKQIKTVPFQTQGPSTFQTATSRFHRLCSAYSLWIYLLIIFIVCPTDSIAELCVYQQRRYDIFTSSYESFPVTKDCRWGCCTENHTTPCCNAPIGLIVGAVFGAILIFSLFIVICCCCCFCRRRRQNANQRRSVLRFALETRTTNSNDVTQETGMVYRTDASGLPEYPGTAHYDPPPSYDEVMRGESNQGFKPDTDTS